MRSAAIFLLLGLALTGCNREEKKVDGATPRAVTGSGIIYGAVRFVGTPPIMGIIPNAICGATQRKIPQESILVSPSGGLRNCLVYLKGISASGGDAMSPALLDQVDCCYVPHVVAAMVGQGLIIRSSDAAPHNVHLQTAVNPPANYAMVQPGQQAIAHFAYPEIFKVSCDVHPWMTAWVGVFANPYFAVTDDTGKFEIKNVPAGSYTLTVWQERLGEKEQSINIADHQNLEENIAYAPSASGMGK